jgi:hypothetical protein
LHHQPLIVISHCINGILPLKPQGISHFSPYPQSSPVACPHRSDQNFVARVIPVIVLTNLFYLWNV